MATRLTEWRLPTRRTASADTAAAFGRTNAQLLFPLLSRSSKPVGRLGTHIARDMSTIAVGQAMALRMTPNWEAPIEFWKRFEVSPTMLSAIPAASIIQALSRLP